MNLISDLMESCRRTGEYKYENDFRFIRREASSDLLIVFGSFQFDPYQTKFRFFRYSGASGANVLFVADRVSVWYSSGVPGLGDSADEVADSVIKIRDEIGAKRVMTMGGSMGGYASLLFGGLVGADTILAAGPDIRINSIRSKSRRYRSSVFEEHGVLPKYDDLRNVDYSKAGKINVLIGEFDIFDRLQLEGRPDKWDIYTLLGSAHSVPEYLSAFGVLDNVLDHFLFGGRLNADCLISGSRFPDEFYSSLDGIISQPGQRTARLAELNDKYPDNPWPSYLLGSLLRRRNPERALRLMKQAVEIEPRFWRAHRDIASLMQEENPAGAVRHLGIFVENDICAGRNDWIRYLEMLTDSGKYGTARKKTNDFRKRFPAAFKEEIVKSGLYDRILMKGKGKE